MRSRKLLIAVVTTAALATAAVAAARQASKGDADPPLACEIAEPVEGVSPEGTPYGISAITCLPDAR